MMASTGGLSVNGGRSARPTGYFSTIRLRPQPLTALNRPDTRPERFFCALPGASASRLAVLSPGESGGARSARGCGSRGAEPERESPPSRRAYRKKTGNLYRARILIPVTGAGRGPRQTRSVHLSKEIHFTTKGFAARFARLKRPPRGVRGTDAARRSTGKRLCPPSFLRRAHDRRCNERMCRSSVF